MFVGEREFPIRAIQTRSERLKDLVSLAYKEKYNTPGICSIRARDVPQEVTRDDDRTGSVIGSRKMWMPPVGVGFTGALRTKCIGSTKDQSLDKLEIVLGSCPPVGGSLVSKAPNTCQMVFSRPVDKKVMSC